MPPADAASGRAMRDGRGFRCAAGLGWDPTRSDHHSADTGSHVAFPDPARPEQRHAFPAVRPGDGNGDGAALRDVATDRAPATRVCLALDAIAAPASVQPACRASDRSLPARPRSKAVATLLRSHGDGPVPAHIIAFATGVSVCGRHNVDIPGSLGAIDHQQHGRARAARRPDRLLVGGGMHRRIEPGLDRSAADRRSARPFDLRTRTTLCRGSAPSRRGQWT